MTMMGGPIDARRRPTAVNNLATEEKHVFVVREDRHLHPSPASVPRGPFHQ